MIQYHKQNTEGAITIQEYPENFKLEDTTIWSFPSRGNWATHSGKYPGNWSPYVPRNLILRYSQKNDWILDPFLGSGTTLIEARLLGRNAIGVDINPKSIQLSNSNLTFHSSETSKIFTRTGDAKDLSFLKAQSMDLICTHPPYANIIRYSKDLPEDLSLLPYEDFICAIEKVAKECFRILKKDGICAFMIGDIRKNGYVLPLGLRAMQVFTNTGFVLKEIIIKEQHKCQSTNYWRKRKPDFLLLAHEYIFVLEKPCNGRPVYDKLST